MTQISNKDIYELINEFRSEVKDTYVTKDSFEPVKKITYGLVALVLVAVVGALLALVVVKTDHSSIQASSLNLK